ncbi:MAG TPA: PHP domain-containing protein [Solirubrobacteraceae bacterium]
MPESAPTFDLQSHSEHSDGALRPSEVVRLASQAGVELLSLTDHDSVDGVPEAAEAASALGLRLVPGVEISALDAGQGDLHILGYLIDERDHTLRERLETFRGARERRAEAMAEAIRQVGFELDDRTLRERAREGKSIGRPHLAEAAVGHPANADRLAREGRLDPTAFLVAYLIEGAPAFRPREAPSVEQAIRAIHEAGGVAIWAHPFWDLSAPPEVLATIDRFRALGLDGVECFYKTHDRRQTELLADHCDQLGMLSTGSSDFHGPLHRQFSRFRAFSTYGRAANLGRLAG